MNRKTFRIISALFLVLLILALIIAYCHVNSASYLEKKADRMRGQIINSYRQNYDSYTSIAVDFLEASGGQSLYYNHHRVDNNLSESLQEKIKVFIHSTGNEFDSLYVGGQTANLYPSDACVFRKTIYQHKREVYCWIDLIYSPSWESVFSSDTLQIMEKAGIIERIDASWFAVILYGF